MIITSEDELYLLLNSDFSRRKQRKSKHNSTPPSCVFLTFNWYLEPWSVVLTRNSVTEKDLRKTRMLKNPLLVLVLLILVQLYHMIMVMVTRKLNLEKYQDIMEILKNFLSGKPTSTVMSWV